MVLKQIKLQAWSDNNDVAPIVINQNDVMSRTVDITLVDNNSQPVNLTGKTVRVHFAKPDKTIVYIDAVIINATSGAISVTLTSQCTAANGIVRATVQVVADNIDTEATLYFTGLQFRVLCNNVESSIESSNEFAVLLQKIGEVTQLTRDLADGAGIPAVSDKAQTINWTTGANRIQSVTAFGYEKQLGTGEPSPDNVRPIETNSGKITVNGVVTQPTLQSSLCEGDTLETNVLVGGVPKSREKHVRKKLVLNGSENWVTADTFDSRRCVSLSNTGIKPLASGQVANIVCDKYAAKKRDDTYTCAQGISTNIFGHLVIYDANYNTNDINLWKAHLAANPVTLVYDLAAPTEYLGEPIDISNPAGDISISGEGDIQVSFVPVTRADGLKKPVKIAGVDFDGTQDITVQQLMTNILPVGYITEFYTTENPGIFWGGTWVTFGAGQTVVGVNPNDTDFNAAGKTGGEKNHLLTSTEMPSHNHSVPNFNDSAAEIADNYVVNQNGKKGYYGNIKTTSVGNNSPHNNMPPYITAYRWRKTA
ncbi:phage baseplate protein [Scatolibacter rhodanostii]|uniref:phage baseplate protein n=1 Tax=Scatolibacter rhodanostii TaxID=2014781 RepID=UPI000C06AB64|nr:BppU family phage baseplate upper protein [Scatolibacter rhodanostii]